MDIGSEVRIRNERLHFPIFTYVFSVLSERQEIGDVAPVQQADNWRQPVGNWMANPIKFDIGPEHIAPSDRIPG